MSPKMLNRLPVSGQQAWDAIFRKLDNYNLRTGRMQSLNSDKENSLKVKVKKLHQDAILPRYAKIGDAAMDMYAAHDAEILPGETVLVGTGIAMEIPPGYFGSARERSGLSVKGVRLGGGVIDSGYRGEIKGILTALSKEVRIARGDRIFQIIIQPCIAADLELVAELSQSERATDGFGSTGR